MVAGSDSGDEGADERPRDEVEALGAEVVTLRAHVDADRVHRRVGHVLPRVARARDVEHQHRAAEVIK